MIALILSSVILIYTVVIGFLIYGFTKVNTIEYFRLNPKTKFTIIVPFRNENENLPVLLDSLSKLNYPVELFEVLLVDDESKEEFSVVCSPFPINIVKSNRVSSSPKKDAITTAMQYVNSDWVVTTDADCTAPENWLLTLDNYIQLHDVSMIASAVTYNCNNSFLHHFQQLDLASLQGATIGSFGINKGFMCNGANFAYTKSLFTALNGFDGNDKIASGDDVFLLQKAIAKFPRKVHYLKSKNTIVTTKPMNDWKYLFYQRVRWASKTSSYQSGFGKALGVVVFSGNLALVITFLLSLTGFITLQYLALQFFLKFIIDSILIYQANTFLSQQSIRYLVLSSLLYPFFSACVAFYSLVGTYEWRGRKF